MYGNDVSLNHFEIRGGDELYVSSCCQVVLKDAAANVSDYSKMSVLGLHIAAPNAVQQNYYTHTYIHTYMYIHTYIHTYITCFVLYGQGEIIQGFAVAFRKGMSYKVRINRLLLLTIRSMHIHIM